MTFLERARNLQQRSEWDQWVAKCWPEILAVVEVAEEVCRAWDGSLRTNGPIVDMNKFSKALEALDRKAGD